MTSNDHYRAAMKIVHQVEEAEAEILAEEAKGRLQDVEDVRLFNENAGRVLALAQVHATLALVRKDS